MKVLNLTNLEESDIKYKISRFPDGQQQVTIILNDNFTKFQAEYKLSQYSELCNKSHFNIQLKARLNNFKDLELIICAVASLRELGIKNIELYVPYFLGSRSDRKFEEGSNNYLKTVICPIINSLNFTKVTVLDPHSDVLEACLNNFNSKDNLEVVTNAFWELYNNIWDGGELSLGDTIKDDVVIVSPDAGANKKIFKLAEKINYTGEIITCSKDRDVDGKLTRTKVPFHKLLDFKDVIIIDDICDGGRTFINIAKEINKLEEKYNQPIKKYLIVTHGIFSAGYTELNKYFDGIFCTNSYSDIKEYEYHALSNVKTNVKQLKVI